MATKETLNSELKEAMRRRDELRRNVMRLLISAVKNAEIEKQGELEQSEFDRVLQKEAKQRRDAIAEYEKAGRDDLAANEQAELAVIESLLPQQMSADEVRVVAQAQIARVGATGPKEIGKVMGPLMAQLRGKADGALIQQVVRELLAEGDG